jgi:uncharacterized protein YnzC (UPF0291/DUF896 family)
MDATTTDPYAPQTKYRKAHLEYYRNYMRTWYQQHPDAAQKNRERAYARRGYLSACRDLCRIGPIFD